MKRCLGSDEPDPAYTGQAAQAKESANWPGIGATKLRKQLRNLKQICTVQELIHIVSTFSSQKMLVKN
jgi:hypothetical protein